MNASGTTGVMGVATEADHDAKTPVNTVRLSESTKQFVVDECEICGDTHYHGSKDRVVAEGGRSHRAAHCSRGDHSGGYYLELADDAEPPKVWFDRLGVDR